MSHLKIGIVGASGLVGQKIIEVIQEMKINYTDLVLYTSFKSANKEVKINNSIYKYIELREDTIDPELDLVFFSAGATTSKKFAQLFTKNKTYVVDNSSAYRTNSEVPLIIPEVNLHHLNKENYLVSNPNCSTTQALLPLNVIKNLFGLKRVDYTTYQAVSGSGINGILDLENTARNLPPKCYKQVIHNNVIAQIGAFTPSGFSEEEIKMVNETQKMLDMQNLPISALCIRVPVINSHTVSLVVKTTKNINLELLKNTLTNSKGIILQDNLEKEIFPQPLNATNFDEVFVGRIRVDLFDPSIVHLICCSDNLRKGAATNTVQIGYEIINKFINND